MTSHLEYRKKQYFDVIDNKKYGKLKGLVSVEINPTELCNRKCGFCPRSEKGGYPNRNLHLSKEIIVKVVEELLINDFRGIIHFSGFGEPLLNPDVVDYIKYIKTCAPHITVEMNTNGDKLCMKTLTDLRDYIDTIIIDCYDGEEQKKRLQELLSSVNFTKYIIRELWSGDEMINSNYFNNRGGSMQGIGNEYKDDKRCFIPFYKLYIDWNGDVLLCCNDWQRLQKNIGNVMRQPLIDIWHGAAFLTVRSNLLEGKRIDNACKNCNVCGTLQGYESTILLSTDL
jgi:MoaA/NifB/PqqE/SkfB family radical SAM enzyme